MKISQRLIFSYYRSKVNLIALLSPKKAAKAAFKIFCTPYTRRKKYVAPPIFVKAEKLSFKIFEFKIHCFRWKPEISSGHKILICHGFDSLSYRFEMYITLLLQEGFEVLAFDAPAHGLSSGTQITLPLYCDTVLEMHKRFGPIDGIIAHSLGGLGAGLALEKIEDHKNKRFVLIAPATESWRAIHTFFNHIKVSNSVKEEFEKLIVGLAGYPSSWYSVSRIMEQITTPTLWVHDKEDTITPFDDMKHMLEKNLPHIEFEITQGLGHSVYRDNKIAKRVASYLACLKHNSQPISQSP